MSIIKNIQHEQVVKLCDEIQILNGQVVSKTLVQNNYVSVTIFAFSKGESISTHKSHGDAMITILEGNAQITIDGKNFNLSQGQSIVMPANLPHAVFATQDFKMLLNVVFPC